jgi:glycosyltransferase involved in cell wall biosynthesis
MPEIIIRFPNTHLYVAGHNIALDETLKDKLKMTYYGKYIRSLIMKYKLEKNITFTGNLDEKTMCKRYLKSHVFVSSSSIENSPNSLGEAMLLGVPCVASCVGGVKDMLKDKEEGFIYPFNEAYMLSYYVCEIFQNDKLALQFSNNARKHAQKTHNKSNNMGKIIDIYKKIIDKGNVNSK